MSHYPTCALIQETRQSNLPNFTLITPAIIHYSGKKQEVVVNINNTTQSTVKISPRAVVAELQLVTRVCTGLDKCLKMSPRLEKPLTKGWP